MITFLIFTTVATLILILYLLLKIDFLTEMVKELRKGLS